MPKRTRDCIALLFGEHQSTKYHRERLRLSPLASRVVIRHPLVSILHNNPKDAHAMLYRPASGEAARLSGDGRIVGSYEYYLEQGR